MKTQEEFFLAHAVDGELSSEHMAQMLNLPEGDSGVQTPASGSEPDAALEAKDPDAGEQQPKKDGPAAADPVVPEPEKVPVILAKDGVHTIGYEKLVEAREGEKTAKEEAAALKQELETLKKAAPTPAPTAAPAPAATPEPGAKADFGDFSDEALEKGIVNLVEARVAAIVDARVAERLSPLQQKQETDAATLHLTTIYTAHPDLDSLVESKELNQWIEKQPSFARAGYRTVLSDGTAADVVEMFDAFKEATGKTAAPPAPTPAPAAAKPDPAAAAQAAIAAARTAPPSSLSEIPAGSAAHHDEATAMLEMSATGLMGKFEGKSPEQIMALMNKVL